MGTAVDITVYGAEGEKIINDISESLDYLENQEISWRVEGSEVWKLNHYYVSGESYEISDSLASAIEETCTISDKADGLLDITIRPLADCWGIEDGEEEIPEADDIEAALSQVDYTSLHVEKNESGSSIIIDRSDMTVDLGAVGKGMACDSANQILAESSLTGAIVAVGGSVVTYGSKPDGSNWQIGIRNPRGESGSICGILNISAGENCYISTSGDYEKYFIAEDGTRYHHILNLSTGYPADTGLISATVIAEDGLKSDALSTACILLGKDRALELVNEENAEAILIDSDLNVYVTDGIKENFELTDKDYTIK
jgi:thiamine biosynthesis lipoprotein